MLLKLYQAGQPVLRRKARRLTKQQLAGARTQAVIDFMVATLRDAPGVGLAAPQVGEAVRIVIIEDRVKYHDQVPPLLLKEQGRTGIRLKILVNPVLEVIDPSTRLYFEGCLSVDGYVAAVARAGRIKVTAWDRHGKDVSYIASGWNARILQHEVDHLEGKLLIDRMQPASFMSVKNFGLLWRKASEASIKKAFAKEAAPG
jgi:peptide deformylase